MTYRPDPDNLRSHPERNKRLVRQSLEEVGAFRSIAVDGDGIVRAGNATHEEALALGYELIEIETKPNQLVVVKRPDLVGDAARRAAFYDNASSDTSFFDSELLAAALRETPQIVGGVLTDDELAAIIGAHQEPIDIGGAGDEFDPTPAEGPTRCQLGDLWSIGERGQHRLLVGDCTDRANVARLMGGGRAGAVVTDPPYGQNQEGVANDDPEGLLVLFDGCLQALPATDAAVIAFQSTRLFPAWLDAIRAAGHTFERALTYYDTGGWSTFPWRGWMPHSQIILISSIGKPRWPKMPTHVRDVYSVNNQLHTDSTFVSAHPTMKHLDTVQSLVEHAMDSGIVYDPFLGSGTTLIAAHRLRFACYGCEVEPRHADVILRRAEAAGLPCARYDHARA